MGFFKRNKNKDLNHDPHNILSNETLSKASSDSSNVLILNELGAHGKFTSQEKEPSMKVKLSKHCCGTKNLTFAYGLAGTGKTEQFVKPNLLNDDANYIVFTKRPNELSNVIKRMKKNGYKIDCLDYSLPMGKQYNPFDNICTVGDARMFCRSITRALNDKYYPRVISPLDGMLHDFFTASITRDPFYDYAEANLRDAILMYVFLELKTYSFLEASNLLQSKTDQELLELFESSQNIDSDVMDNFKKYLISPDDTRKAVRMKVNIDFIQLDSTYNDAPGIGSNTIDLTRIFKEKHAIFIGSFGENSKIMDRMFVDRIIDFAGSYCFQDPKRPLHIIIDDAFSFEYNSRFKEFVSYALDKKIYVSITMYTMDDIKSLTGTTFCGFSDCNAVQLSATETCTVLSNGNFRTDEKLDPVK